MHAQIRISAEVYNYYVTVCFLSQINERLALLNHSQFELLITNCPKFQLECLFPRVCVCFLIL